MVFVSKGAGGGGKPWAEVFFLGFSKVNPKRLWGGGKKDREKRRQEESWGGGLILYLGIQKKFVQICCQKTGSCKRRIKKKNFPGGAAAPRTMWNKCWGKNEQGEPWKVDHLWPWGMPKKKRRPGEWTTSGSRVIGEGRLEKTRLGNQGDTGGHWGGKKTGRRQKFARSKGSGINWGGLA